MEEQKEHKRRVRYKGTHPRNYNEKYKELNPEKYQGTIEHVIQKGSTPAGMHIPILVDEILDFLNSRKWGHSVGDGTESWTVRVTRVLTG